MKQTIAFFARPYMTNTARINHVIQTTDDLVSAGIYNTGRKSQVRETVPATIGGEIEEKWLRMYEWTFCYQ